MTKEEQLTDILRKVENGEMDSTVAFDQILRLFNVSESLPSEEQLKLDFDLLWRDDHGIWAGANLDKEDCKKWAIKLFNKCRSKMEGNVR